MPLQNLTERLAAAARELGSEDVEHTLEKGVAPAVEMIEGCDGAGVTMVHRGSHFNTKLFHIASELVRTRRVPGQQTAQDPAAPGGCHSESQPAQSAALQDVGEQ